MSLLNNRVHVLRNGNINAVHLAFVVLLSALHTVHLVEARRGPHHPCGEVRRATKAINHHLTHDNEHMQQEIASSPLAALDSKPVAEMSDEEKAFYYFKLHDLDNNDVLDGLELMQAALHHHAHGDAPAAGDLSEKGEEEANELQDGEDNLEHIIGVIDDFIAHADNDYDGFLNFGEYTSATRLDGGSEGYAVQLQSQAQQELT